MSVRNRWILLGAASVIGSALVMCAWWVVLAFDVYEQDSSGPQSSALVVIPAVQHFATEAADEVITRRFQIRNDTTRDVRIVEVRTGCSTCTRVKAPGSVAARSEGEIVMTADVSGRRGKVAIETQLITDHPSFPTLRFSIEGMIVADDLGEIPYELGTFLPGSSLNELVRLSKNGFPEARLTSAEIAEGDGLSAEIVDSALGSDFVVRIRGVTPEIQGGFERRLRLTAEKASWKAGTLQLRGTIASRWKAPREIYLGHLAAGASAQKQIEIVDTFAGSPRAPSVAADAVSVGCDLPGAAAVISAEGAGHWQITIDVHNRGRAGKIAGHVVLTTRGISSSQVEALRIPVYVRYD